MKIVATYVTYEQVSESDFNTVRLSKVFDIDARLSEIVRWCRQYKKDATMNDVIISCLDE